MEPEPKTVMDSRCGSRANDDRFSITKAPPSNDNAILEKRFGF